LEFLSVVLFAFAVSVDGFGVGLAYGLRDIRISFFPLLVISITSAFAITISMYFGAMVASIFHPIIASRIGAVILISVGIWIVLEAWSKWKKIKFPPTKTYKTNNFCLLRFKIPGLGIVIQILKEPEEADFDKSGNINLKEALFLGFALAMDALGAGFGAAVAGYQLLLIPLFVAIFKMALVSTGLWMGRNNRFNSMGVTGSILPGIILILLGVSLI
jgi:putative sporulation protein YtaF